jgi:hypothetical protein
VRRHLAPRRQSAQGWLTRLVSAAVRFEQQTGGSAADLLTKSSDRHVDEQATVYEAKRLRRERDTNAASRGDRSTP